MKKLLRNLLKYTLGLPLLLFKSIFKLIDHDLCILSDIFFGDEFLGDYKITYKEILREIWRPIR